MAEAAIVVPRESTAAGLARRDSVVILVLLSVAHFGVDLYSAALGALHPVLAAKFGLSLTQAGILGGTMVFSSSMMQPVYGYLSDRYASRLFTVLAPATAALCISALGLAPGFPWLVALVALGGVGVAAFHPQASASASRTSRTRRGRWMSIFISAGLLGFAAGPVYFSAVVLRLGLDRMLWAAIPGVAISAVLYFRLGGPGAVASGSGSRFEWRALAPVWRPLAILYFLVFIRSVVQVTFNQFLPLYLHRERGFPVAEASVALSIFLAAGAVGGFLGGNLADRFGGRRVILYSMLGAVPFLAGFFLLSGGWAILSLAAGGLMLVLTNPINIVMAQELAPGSSGTVSALMMGFAWGAAGFLFIPLTGWASDHLSLHQVLGVLAATPLIGWALAWKLPGAR